MRNISAATLETLSTTQGIEPICLVRVLWTNDFATSIVYADRMFPEDNIVGRILEISNIEDVVNISKGSNTSSITIKLDDSDGTIKSIFDNTDIIKQYVYVYQWFTNLSVNDAFVIFEGEINSPVVWREGERTITFDVVSLLEDIQYGFAADEGNFAYIPENIIGKAWPLPFGTIDMVPSLKLFDTPQGLLSQPTQGQLNQNAARLASLWASYYKAVNSMYECLTKALFCLQQSETLQNDGVPTTAIYVLPGLQVLGDTPPVKTAADQWIVKGNQYQVQEENYRLQALKILKEILAFNQKPTNKLELTNGAVFPQGVNTTITIGNSTYTGQFSGSTFTVISSSSPFQTDGTLLGSPLTINQDTAAVQYAQAANEQNFFYNVAGSAVVNSSEMTYIVSLMEVSVAGVYANYNGVRTAVPSNYYTISYVDFGGGVQCTYLTMATTLPIIDKAWSDKVYCTMTSPVGPNVTDVLIWLIGQYTVYGYDETSFATAAGFTVQYPVGFALLKQGNIVKLLKEIAFQARCALWFKEGLFYIKFLPDMSTYVDTLDETDIEYGTMEVSCSPTEDLVTKYTATYTADGVSIVNGGIGWVPGVPTISGGMYVPSPVDRNGVLNTQALNTGEDLVIWYYNVEAYGLLEKTDPYYIYNIPDLVERASMFWLVRYTNVWKRLKVSTFLTHLDLETFDYVLLNFSHPWVAAGPIIGMVESCLYNSAEERVELTIWLPVRFGEMQTYPFAAPVNISPTLIFPEEYQAPSAYQGTKATGNLIPPPIATSLFNRGPNGSTNNTQGINPSDDGFTAPAFETYLGTTTPFTVSNNTTPSGASNQYRITPVVNPDLSFDAPGVYPGVVQSQIGSSNIYNVDVYFQGFITQSSPPVSVQVQQMLIDVADTIPPGTPTMVNRCRVLDSTDATTGLSIYRSEYTMQVPVWLDGTESDDSGGNPIPQANYGGGSSNPGTGTVPGEGNSTPGGDTNEGGSPSDEADDPESPTGESESPGAGDFEGDEGSGGGPSEESDEFGNFGDGNF